jgi:hypothetical protein
MKPLHALALILPASLLLPGCPFECGGFAGAGDVMYRRGDDVLFLCENGGFTLSLGGQAIAGRFGQETKQLDGANGETGARVFSLEVAADGSATSPELGAGWARVPLDKTALDHGDVQCTGLTTQAWWPQPEDALPAMTAFAKPAGGFASVDDCRAAQHAGTYPASARCADSALLCPNGHLGMTGGSGVVAGSYTASFGEIAGSTPAGQIEGVFAADGTLHSGSDVWHQIPVDQVDPALVTAGCGAGA